MVLLDPDRFLNELGKLFERNKEKKSVQVTMKHSNLKPRKSKKEHPDAEFKCLVRVTDGHKTKFSTVITQREQLRFQESYNTILKAHMDALKKREKVKSKPSKKAMDAQQAA